MAKAEVGADNIIKTTMEHLSEEQKKEVNDMIEHYCELCIDYFSTIRGGKTVQKMEFPGPLLHDETTLTTTDVNQVVNSAIHHTFID
jgi:hypothetical protein